MKNKFSYNTITATSCHNQRVLLRADLNVPISGKSIDDDFRLQELRPTLDLLLGQHATIILVTHLGRPHKDKNDAALSTTLITTWLQEQGYRAIFAPTIAAAHEQIKHHPNTIIVLENIRTFPGEMAHDLTFAKELAQLGDCYVNDAFGTLHRDDTSISLTPLFFAPEKRFIGLLISRELQALAPLITVMHDHYSELLDVHGHKAVSPKNKLHGATDHNALHPFVVILGGGKVADKLPLIENLLDKADTILLCPAIVSTFMKASGIDVGKSLVDDSQIDHCKELIARATNTKTKLIFPTDLQVATGSWNGPLSNKNIAQLTSNDVWTALGPVSTKVYASEIAQAGTIFFNAAMGFPQRPETLVAAKILIEAIGASSAYGVIGGGHSVALANTCNRGTGIRHLSTGGGATLTYLSGAPLPGLDALCAIK
jgi:phosphoglycerate kinase